MITSNVNATTTQGNGTSSCASNQTGQKGSVLSAVENGDVKLMVSLSKRFLAVSSRGPKNANDPMQGGIFKIWDEETIIGVVDTIKNRNELLRQAKCLLNEYLAMGKTRSGMKNFGREIRDLDDYTARFEKAIPLYIETLPVAFDKAAQEFRAKYKKEQYGFEEAKRKNDKSRLQSFNNPHSWYQSLRNQMKAHIMIYEAFGGEQLNAMKKTHTDSLSYANTICDEIISWQGK